MNLRTKYITLEDGYIKIANLARDTRTFFQRTDPNSFIIRLQSAIGLDMKIKPYEYITRRIRLSCVLIEPIEDLTFLTNLLDNNKIDTSRCAFQECEPESDKFKIYFAVTPLCFQCIKDEDFLLKINNNESVEITVLENPYPELFNDQ